MRIYLNRSGKKSIKSVIGDIDFFKIDFYQLFKEKDCLYFSYPRSRLKYSKSDLIYHHRQALFEFY